MSVLIQAPPSPALAPEQLIGSAPPSPAGSVESLRGLRTPPALRLPRVAQVVWFGRWQTHMMFSCQRRFGEVFTTNTYVKGHPVVTHHPDHIRSLFTQPDLAETLATESPLAPILGPNSTLIAREPRHMPQRKLLLPPFHGEAIARYEAAIAEATEREIDRWQVGHSLPLAPRMQAITLDVIMAGIFGIEGRPERGTVEHRLRSAIKWLTRASTLPGAKLGEWMNLGHDEPYGIHAAAIAGPDRAVYALIRKRRQAADLEQRTDIMSLIMRARTDAGDPLTDRELRDELMTLVLAGHETTANQLAWTWERLLRAPAAHRRLVDSVRGDAESESSAAIEATILESMRARPVIPITGRRVRSAWQLGEYGIPKDTPVGISILLLHHRPDVYPDPFAFRPERWDDHTPPDHRSGEARRRAVIKPGSYEWIPFGGGTRRCLGATLAMAEMRVVLRTMARRLDLAATRPEPERPVHRNVTMIPGRGGEVRLLART